MRGRAPLSALAAAAVALGGCSGLFRKANPDRLAASATPNYPESPRRLLVYSDATVPDAHAAEFEGALRQALAPCGVRVAAYRPFSVKDDRAEEYRRLGAPDHTLALSVWKSAYQGHQAPRQITLSLLNARQAEVWSARSEYKPIFVPTANASGYRRFMEKWDYSADVSYTFPVLAQHVVQSLRLHRVLKTCPG